MFEKLGELAVAEVGYTNRSSKTCRLEALHGRPGFANVEVPAFRMIEEVEVDVGEPEL
jgi:hypothetical protein